MKALHGITAAVLLASAALIAFAADDKPRAPGGGKRCGQRQQDAPLYDVRFLFKTEVPAHPFDVVLGRATDKSITASVLAYADREGVIAYGTKASAPTTCSQSVAAAAYSTATITSTSTPSATE